MTRYEHDGLLFISLNPAEHVALTLPGGMLDELYKSGRVADDQFVFFTNEQGSLLRVGEAEYQLLRECPPHSPFDETLKRLISEHYLSR
jgi:hypothetical protein